ncbi:MAG: HEAT repeat domain-containing protein [Myxococcales bacterium]
MLRRKSPFLGFVLGALLALSGSDARAAIWPSATRRAERELASSDVAARQAAVASLSELPRAAARRLLLRALDDTDAQVASSALELLLRLETPNVTERVVPWLSGSDKRLRLSAALALAVAPAANATPALGRALGDSDAEVRAAAAAALGASRNEGAVLPLLGHLDDSVPEVREAVANALGALGDARAVLPLIGKIEDPRPSVRAAVARALGSLRDPRSGSALLLALRDSDRAVVIAVVRALGALAETAAVSPLAALLRERSEPEARRALLQSLGRIGSVEAGQALVKELGSDEPGHEREAVLGALVLAPGAFTAPLRECLDSVVDIALAEGCALGLAEVHDTASSSRVRAALDRGRLSPKVGLAVLGALGDARALSAALERLTVPDADTRAAAMDAAEALLSPKEADGRAVEPLARALLARAVSRPERLRLVGLLGRTGSERALPTLLPLLESASDPALAESAALALGSVPGKATAAALLKALDAEEMRVKRAAALSIRRAQSPELLGPLLARLERGGQSERALVYLALAGPLSQSRDDALVARAVRLLDVTRGSERDELLEALAASRLPRARAALSRLGKSPDFGDRAKVAELMAGQPDPSVLTALVRDSDARVRSNAAWALGFVDASAAAVVRAALEPALKDHEASVSGNAAISLGRLAVGKPELAEAALCAGPLHDARASVREQALRGLALARARCADGYPATLLATDARANVRRAAAELLLQHGPDAAERRLLARCQESDTHASVADTCAGAARSPTPEIEPTAVLIVQSAGGDPTPGAPFALLWADGALRLGSADRRGGVFEPRAPHGAVESRPYAGGD